MFIQNKYTRIYYELMARAKNRNMKNDELYERHHILPKSFSGTNKNENIVLLTIREHFIAHCLLTRMCSVPAHKKSMSYAFVTMNRSRDGNRHSKINSKLYELIKKRIRSDFTGKNNPFYGKGHFGKDNHFYGKTHTEETKKKIKESLKGKNIGKDNHFYGKTHTEETKRNQSKIKSISILVIFENGTRKKFINRREFGFYLGYSGQLGWKLAAHKNINKHLWPKYNIKDIQCV